MDRYSAIRNTYGNETFNLIQTSKILVVGAGGIGCEILKNLVLAGFIDIEIIDLDTIDVSNLNRQFLFRTEHVGQPKAIVAAAAAKRFNSECNIVAHYANVKKSEFGISYVEKFNVVLNALDNVDARRHVNRLCLAAQVPLIDSGTTGYLGQVMPILKGRTACYECQPKMTPKVYPICTIRSTPDKPVHCIVWAKELFKLLFGKPSDSMLFEDVSLDTEQKSCYMHLLNISPTDNNKQDPLTIVNYSRNLLVALYETEIQKKLEVDLYKTAVRKPVPLSSAVIDSACARASALLQTAGDAPVLRPSLCAGWDNRMHTVDELLVEWVLCLRELINNDLLGQLSFDKDDAVTMKFVWAAANLRSSVFGIELQSFHDCKGVAGNIIPAIATANSIVAAVQVQCAIKLVADKTAMCPHTYCNRAATRQGLYLTPSEADKPSATCFVCNSCPITLQIDTGAVTFGDFLSKIVKAKLGFNEPSILIGSSQIHEEGEDVDDEDFAENLVKLLKDCSAGGIVHDCMLAIDDNTQNLQVSVLVKHCDAAHWEQLNALTKADGDVAPVWFIISSPMELAASTSSSTAASSSSSSSSISSSSAMVSSLPGKRCADDMTSPSTTMTSPTADEHNNKKTCLITTDDDADDSIVIIE